jgi:hypothetical protein
MRTIVYGWLVVVLLLMTGCVGTNSTTAEATSPVSLTAEIKPSQTSRIPDLSQDTLKNADYSTPALEEFLPIKARDKTIKLVDGQYHYIYESGAATELVIKFQQYAVGDLDSDGQNDSAVILFVSPGGSGIFYFLTAVLNNAGQPRVTSATSLGDRVVIEKLAVQDGIIIVDLVTQGPEDAMCCPTMKVEQHYHLQNGGLVQMP